MVAHGPALVGAWRSLLQAGFGTDDLAGCLALTLAMGFFGLRFLGRAALPVRTGRRAWIAFCLIVALIHVDCLRPEAETTVLHPWAVAATMNVLVVEPTRLSRALKSALEALGASGRSIPIAPRSAETVWLDLFLPHCWILRFRRAIPRSPPVFA